MARELTYSDKPWLRNYAPSVPGYLKYQEICLPEMLEATVRDYPDNTALICQDYMMTYKELKDQVDRLAACLVDMGIQKMILWRFCCPTASPLSLLIMRSQSRRHSSHEQSCLC